MIPRDGTAAIFGASGGIGGALASRCREAGFASVVGFSRQPGGVPAGIEAGRADPADPKRLGAGAAHLAGLPPLRLVLVANGVLHLPGITPEKSYRTLDAEAMSALFAINAIGPAMIAKELLPRLAAEGRAVFAALSARVGSIGDNRLGGWHAYRASKAALNMIIRNLAIELARQKPDAVCIGLHPGTVATALSQPFQRGVAPERLFTPDASAARLLDVLDGARPEQSGCCLAWDGSVIPP